MSGETATELDTRHKANSTIITNKMTANNAKVAALPSNVGRTGAPIDPKFMQGTANGVLPDRFMTDRNV